MNKLSRSVQTALTGFLATTSFFIGDDQDAAQSGMDFLNYARALLSTLQTIETEIARTPNARYEALIREHLTGHIPLLSACLNQSESMTANDLSADARERLLLRAEIAPDTNFTYFVASLAHNLAAIATLGTDADPIRMADYTLSETLAVMNVKAARLGIRPADPRPRFFHQASSHHPVSLLSR